MHVFSIVTGTNDLKTFAEDASCKCKCKFDGRKYSSNPKWNNDKCRCQCKEPEKISCARVMLYLESYYM